MISYPKNGRQLILHPDRGGLQNDLDIPVSLIRGYLTRETEKVSPGQVVHRWSENRRSVPRRNDYHQAEIRLSDCLPDALHLGGHRGDLDFPVDHRSGSTLVEHRNVVGYDGLLS